MTATYREPAEPEKAAGGSETIEPVARAMLPEPLRAFLVAPELAPVWRTVRSRLERNGLAVDGAVSVELDWPAASALSGLLGRSVPTGRSRLRLAEIDAALRGSAAVAGLVSVLAALDGPLADRPAVRAAAAAERDALWAGVDAALSTAGLANAEWVPKWIVGLQRSGTLMRAGVTAAIVEVQKATRALEQLAATSAPYLAAPAARSAAPVAPTSATFRRNSPGVDGWELAVLAARVAGGDAHALDGDRLAGLLVLRAASAAENLPLPADAAGRRAAWARLGVSPDVVSGTVLVWNLRPAGDGRWPAMMAERASLGLVTHLTAAELTSSAVDAPLTEQGTVVWCCENPQVVQAAARDRAPGTLVCFFGNPASAGVLLLKELLAAGAVVRYHGDFDWPGVAIAGRMFSAGAVPWRMSAADYVSAIAALPEGQALPLSGRPEPTVWDPGLAAKMAATGLAIHEESLISVLLTDLR